LPLAFVVAGGLARLVNAEFGIAEVGGALEQLAPLSACLAAGWALARVVKERFDAAEAVRVASRQPASQAFDPPGHLARRRAAPAWTAPCRPLARHRCSADVQAAIA